MAAEHPGSKIGREFAGFVVVIFKFNLDQRTLAHQGMGADVQSDRPHKLESSGLLASTLARSDSSLPSGTLTTHLLSLNIALGRSSHSWYVLTPVRAYLLTHLLDQAHASATVLVQIGVVCKRSFYTGGPILTRKMTTFCDIAPCSPVAHRRFIGAYNLHHQGDNGGSTHLWNVSQLLRDYTAHYLRRLSSSYSLPWEPEISTETCSLRIQFDYCSR
jgi:hypothetical protein